MTYKSRIGSNRLRTGTTPSGKKYFSLRDSKTKTKMTSTRDSDGTAVFKHTGGGKTFKRTVKR